ncbi:hypothetical protein [Filobacillus milosensis]|nr:hypothetical protein [Filobacillus milosensis]
MNHEKEDYDLAHLTPEQKELLKQAESETGLILIAYEYNQDHHSEHKNL